jgi:hypothetical protein
VKNPEMGFKEKIGDRGTHKKEEGEKERWP